MPTPVNTGTRDIPLRLAEKITETVNAEWNSGNFIENVSPVTQDLLKFWFADSFCENRNINFHEGQKQAILNAIYLHEILKIENVFEIYEKIDSHLLQQMHLPTLKKAKYNFPKYGIKMATGTGKTWVMNALMIWQFLNARNDESRSGRYSKNFLLVAPGLIVYERLLDAFLGKENEDGSRDFDKSDFKRYDSLFIPQSYKEEVFGFIQSCVVKKEEIGSKVTGDGLISITNWHLLAGLEEETVEALSPLENPSQSLKKIFPISPGTSAGHSLEQLDKKYLSGNEIEFLAELEDLVVINDEAHHIHENKNYGEITEVEWQKSLNKIAQKKGKKFIQIDFSATPYDVTGSGQTRTKHYFPHTIVDFDLRSAIHKGLVKTIALDKRKEITDLPLDFKAERDGDNVVGLSEGQKVMLRAGIKKLKILEEEFVNLTKDNEGVSSKHPKMLVICEDTKVSPFVAEFLVYEGMTEDEVFVIDSGRKKELSEKEWTVVKQKLFNVDQHPNPKVIISVLMLREGFDVNNICVIVPLRSSEAPILLEQVIGRGLRLMWREPEYNEIRQENLIKLLARKEAPTYYIDILSIIEHPAFTRFYEDLTQIPIFEEEEEFGGGVTGDIIRVGLKNNFKDYDFFIPFILKDKEEILEPIHLNTDKLESYKLYKLEVLKNMITREEMFYSEELTVKTRFGDYLVKGDLLNTKSYNEFLAKLVQTVSSIIVKTGQRSKKEYPVMQISNVELLKAIDKYIRTRLFGEDFDPFVDYNWKILLTRTGLLEHIVKEFSKVIFKMQNSINISEAIVFKKYFSDIDELKMREKYCLDIVKTIYQRQSYPSNKGLFEKDFMEFCDNDSEVEALIKVNENYHTFASILYIRTDGIIASYYPDFLVRTKDFIYIIETKAERDLSNPNVKQKRLATIDFAKRINELDPAERENREWYYLIIDDNIFKTKKSKGGSAKDIFEYTKISKSKIEGKLFEN
ncbi:MAG: DEAD/DEAH box helicase family protein [bacterium]|nr:DEAD/DEAH box helicase family protein [bacterium]